MNSFEDDVIPQEAFFETNALAFAIPFALLLTFLSSEQIHSRIQRYLSTDSTLVLPEFNWVAAILGFLKWFVIMWILFSIGFKITGCSLLKVMRDV